MMISHNAYDPSHGDLQRRTECLMDSLTSRSFMVSEPPGKPPSSHLGDCASAVRCLKAIGHLETLPINEFFFAGNGLLTVGFDVLSES